MRANIQKIIGQHRENVAQLFQMYGIDLPITIQNVWDALYLKGDEFATLFWSLENVSFTGDKTKTKHSFFSSTPEVKDNTHLVVIGVAIIIVLVVIAFITRKKDAK